MGLRPRTGDIVRKKSRQCGLGREEDREKFLDHSAEVEFVNEENIGSYSIEDILLPLPGWDVMLPSNQCECLCILVCMTIFAVYVAYVMIKVERSISDCSLRKALHWNN